jgi:uncharacterized protein with ParB-like and HNH nuclease domain
MGNFKSDISLKDIFSETLFRIPDYQRGYSWDPEQLDDLWEDLDNLYEAKEHYTGLITITEAKTEDANWTGFRTYYVIDGQQRLTTIIILLKVLIDRAKQLGMKELGSLPISDVVQKYLYRINTNNNALKASILSYAADDPSDEYFKSKILEIKQPTENMQTAYTKRLEAARKYFSEKIKVYDQNAVNELFKIITNKLVFNQYVVEGDREVSMIFESMNNRGKKLSALELLKNRLMYISEKLQVKDEERIALREEIKKAWKIVYEWLGKNDLLDDDEFLRAHWIMYYNYDRRKSQAYADDLLNDIFSIKKVYDKDKGLKYNDVSNYAVSLSDAVKHWYFINYPEKSKGTYDERIINELARLNRINYTAFKPLIMALLLETEGTKEIESLSNILKSCEEYIFKAFALSRKPSNTGDSHFYRLAKDCYNKDVTKTEVISDIKRWTRNNFWFPEFKEYMNDLFKNHEGFYSWAYVNYFLFEYDLHLKEHSKGNLGKAIDWNEYDTHKKDYVSVEHIYPQVDDKECWKKTFGSFSEEQKKKLKNSLGNLLPLSTPRNSSFQNNCFEAKKDDGKGGGYCVGSYSEAEVYKYPEWNAEKILERGLKLLGFMENRWNLQIPDTDKKALLHLDFL